MNELKVFSNSEFGDLGVLVVDGREYFPATACARMLGYAKPRNAIAAHCKGALKQGVLTAGGTQEMLFISEGDLYRLIVHSKLPAADSFERWVFDEVLVSIHRQGAYVPDIAAIVTQTVQATIGEMTRQLMPYLTGCSHAAALPETTRRRRKPALSLIGKLGTELRQEIEDMILDGRHTYFEISDYLRQNYGVVVSKSAIGRYAVKLLERDGDTFSE